MEAKRARELLNKAADALENGENPLGGAFLTHNQVTYDECMSMANNLAIGARIVAYGTEHQNSVEAISIMAAIMRKVLE